MDKLVEIMEEGKVYEVRPRRSINYTTGGMRDDKWYRVRSFNGHVDGMEETVGQCMYVLAEDGETRCCTTRACCHQNEEPGLGVLSYYIREVENVE